MRILLADPQGLVRAGLARLLAELAHGPDALEVTEAGNVTQALVGARVDVDLVLLDVGLPGGEGLAGLRTMRALQPDVPILLLAGEVTGAFVAEAVRAGARGVVPKTLEPGVFLAALRFVLDGGGTFLPLETLTGVSLAVREGGGEEGADIPGAAGAGARPRDPLDRLTARQREVLALMARGRSNREIGDALGIAEGTAKLHVAGVLKALGVQNRTEAALLAAGLGEDAEKRGS